MNNRQIRHDLDSDDSWETNRDGSQVLYVTEVDKRGFVHFYNVRVPKGCLLVLHEVPYEKNS